MTLANEKTGARHTVLVPGQRSVMIATDGKKMIAQYGRAEAYTSPQH